MIPSCRRKPSERAEVTTRVVTRARKAAGPDPASKGQPLITTFGLPRLDLNQVAMGRGRKVQNVGDSTAAQPH